MKNYMIFALVKLFIVSTILISTRAEYRQPKILRNIAVKRQDDNDTGSPQEKQRLNGFQNLSTDSRKGEILRADRFNSIGVKRMKLNDGKLGYYANNDIIDRIKERDVKAESSMKSISFNNQKKVCKTSRRVERDIQNENQNTAVQLVVCEVPSLSCRNCCEGSTEGCTHNATFCRCDPQCTFYNDCCVDYETFCGKKQHFSFGVDREELSCTQPKNVDLNSDSKRLWMVNKCPDNTKSDEISQNCEIADMLELNITNLQKLVPVIGTNNITFRNEFCAKCNGIEDFKRFGFKMTCYVAPPASIRSYAELAEFASKYCDPEKSLSIFREAYEPIRECNQYFRNLCPTVKELNENCNRVVVTVDDCISTTRWCNLNLSKWDDAVEMTCNPEDGSAPARPGGGSRSPSIAPLTVAFRLANLRTVSEVQKSNCPFRGQFYDSYLETCRSGQSVSPPVKQNLDKFEEVVWYDVKGVSTKLLPTLNEFISSLAQFFNFERSQVTALQDVRISRKERRIYRVIRFELQLTNEQTLSLGKSNQTNNGTSNFGNDLGKSTNVLPLRRLLFFSRKSNITVSKEYFISVNSTETIYTTLIVFKTTSRQLACIRKHTYPKGTYTAEQYGKYYYINSTGKTFPKNQVFFEGDGNESISVCEQIVYSTCVGRRVNLTSEEYVKFDNLSIFYNRTKTIYDFGQYDIEDGQIFMCIPEYSSKIIHWIPSDSSVAESYLTLTGFVLSLVCLFLVIQTYLIFPELRNLPGKNVVSLSISLFLVQLLWLIPDQWYPSILCYIVAVIKHYLFLVSFVAMATNAWDTHSAFAGRSVRKDMSTKNCENKKFYKYSAIVWGLPAMFVVTCAVVDQKDIYAVYVNELLCWFDNTQAQEYLFVLPVGLLLLFNVLLFALTVFRIQRVRLTTRLIRADQSHRTMFWIYLKLSALMGFSWLFGFIYLLSGSPVFSYLFVIFASLQGVYIALAFVMKKAVWEKYKKLCGIKQSKYKPDYRTTLVEELSHSKETKV